MKVWSVPFQGLVSSSLAGFAVFASDHYWYPIYSMISSYVADSTAAEDILFVKRRNIKTCPFIDVKRWRHRFHYRSNTKREVYFTNLSCSHCWGWVFLKWEDSWTLFSAHKGLSGQISFNVDKYVCGYSQSISHWAYALSLTGYLKTPERSPRFDFERRI